MSFIPKRYFYDKVILSLLSVLLFTAVITIANIAFRSTSGIGSTDFFVQYRSSAGIGGFRTGNIGQILLFVVFILMTVGFSFVLSVRTYHIKRELSHTILVFGIVLALTAAIVSNALLALR